MDLTNENYFSQEANKEYMSVSQFKAFEACEAAALAEIRGEWAREETAAILVGSYVDAYFEGSLERFRADHPEIFLKNGGLKSDYRKAEEIIDRIESDPEFMSMLNGRRQVVETAAIDGVPVKIKIDVLHNDKIVDLKIMRDFQPIWKDGQKMPWWAAWGYDLQGAVYQEVHRMVTGERLPFFLAAATKEAPSDIGGVEIGQTFLDERLAYFRGMLPRYVAIKRGEVEPKRCGHCAFCRATKPFEIKNAADFFEADEMN